jgi:hypothetical protein
LQVQHAVAWKLCFEQILFPLVAGIVTNKGTQVQPPHRPRPKPKVS